SHVIVNDRRKRVDHRDGQCRGLPLGRPPVPGRRDPDSQGSAAGGSMSTLTIRMPEDKHARLRSLAKARSVSINKLVEELTTVALTQHNTELRFRVSAARGWKKVG